MYIYIYIYILYIYEWMRVQYPLNKVEDWSMSSGLCCLLPLRSVLHAGGRGETDAAGAAPDHRGGAEPGPPLRPRGGGQDPANRRRAAHPPRCAGHHRWGSCVVDGLSAEERRSLWRFVSGIQNLQLVLEVLYRYRCPSAVSNRESESKSGACYGASVGLLRRGRVPVTPRRFGQLVLVFRFVEQKVMALFVPKLSWETPGERQNMRSSRGRSV